MVFMDILARREDSDQTARMRSLIFIFPFRTCHMAHFNAKTTICFTTTEVVLKYVCFYIVIFNASIYVHLIEIYQ